MAKRKPSPAADPAPAPEKSFLGNEPGAAEPAPDAGYTVLARRYRPQGFGDLVGQEPVAQALKNALASNRVAHAYLFTGARGVGKTSTARILAKALNCVRGPTTEPCNACENCKAIALGEDIDVIEIDAASNRGIDEIRELRQTIRSRTSQRSRYKIYIIDEVHMLTREAFNALLKTLEEPPPHVKFIFATTEVQKIPLTILSRCQRFDFAGIGTPRIVERLRAVVAGEGKEADDEALELVARRAQGSMRDAQSLLDQLLAFGGERLTAEQVHRLLGTAHDERVADMAAAVLGGDPKRALDLLGHSVDEGLQLGELLDQLIEYWRDLMVVNAAGGVEGQTLSVSPRYRDALHKQAAAAKLDTLLAGLDVLATTKARLRGSSHGRVLLEMALVRLGRLEDLLSVSQLAQLLSQAPPAPVGASGAGPRPTLSAHLPESMPAASALKKKLTADGEAASAAPQRALAPETLAEIWSEVLAQVPPVLKNQMEKAGLPAILGPNALVLRFPSDYNQAQDYCQEASSSKRIEEALRKVLGRPCGLRFETVGGAAPRAAEAAGSEESVSRYRRLRAEALKNPLVKRAVDVLDAQVMEVEEGFGDAVAGEPERSEPADAEEG